MPAKTAKNLGAGGLGQEGDGFFHPKRGREILDSRGGIPPLPPPVPMSEFGQPLTTYFWLTSLLFRKIINHFL